ncbi:hypothetical protein EVAR_55194_1 [Eumeta japonica]|uniref:Uncharacterized protein n=1 Tax=Eumeta variegata TaxID=151549 RepID=A0A4C1ZE65_EUMVA|nr:hypothetical protein EVAR_55194_1 [Eumeta japonica]
MYSTTNKLCGFEFPTNDAICRYNAFRSFLLPRVPILHHCDTFVTNFTARHLASRSDIYQTSIRISRNVPKEKWKRETYTTSDTNTVHGKRHTMSDTTLKEVVGGRKKCGVSLGVSRSAAGKALHAHAQVLIPFSEQSGYS